MQRLNLKPGFLEDKLKDFWELMQRKKDIVVLPRTKKEEIFEYSRCTSFFNHITENVRKKTDQSISIISRVWWIIGCIKLIYLTSDSLMSV